MRIRFQRFFELIDRPFVIHVVDAALAREKMRLFLLLHLALTGRQAAVQARQEQKGQRAANKPDRTRHGATLIEPAERRNTRWLSSPVARPVPLVRGNSEGISPDCDRRRQPRSTKRA